MTKKKLIIWISATIIIIGGVIAVVLTMNKEEKQPTIADDASVQTEPESDHHDDLDEIGVDHEDPASPPLIVNNKVTTSAEVWAAYIPLAENAAREYVFQRTGESTEDRQARLKSVFNPTSAAITDTPPKVNVSNYTDITANPIVVNTSWGLISNEVVVTVSLRVISRSNTEPHEDVSNIYQAYDVTFASHNGVYKPQAIKFSNKPVIVSGS